MNLRLHLSFKDRVGIVADVSTLIAHHGLNIVSMEVIRRDDTAQTYIEVEPGADPVRREDLFEIMGRIPGLTEIRFIEVLPHETRENQLRVVLDNVSEGIVAISGDGRITLMNRVAREALNHVGQEVLGRNIRSVTLPDYTILDCLRGRGFSNVKKDLIRGTKRYQYFATGRPIHDAAGRIIGAVEIAKDVQEIKALALALTLTDPDQVTFGDIVGASPVMHQAISFAQKIATTDSIVSIRGESGTGKELFARAIHASSGRRGPFVAVNCAAVPEQLLESELFGYSGGAFTGGRKEGKPGLFEVARDGTVFLDEIAELPLASQAKILRLIQDQRLRRIGDTKEIAVNARLITATNRHLEQLVEARLFRTDLYFRINVLPIHIPPLRERTEDLPVLAEHFLFQLAAKLNKDLQTITPAALARLRGHNWPGNVRELKNVIERAAILCDHRVIDVDSILFANEIGREWPGLSGNRPPAPEGGQSLKSRMAACEREFISQALKSAASGRQAARALGLSHTALLNKLKKHRLTLERK